MLSLPQWLRKQKRKGNTTEFAKLSFVLQLPIQLRISSVLINTIAPRTPKQLMRCMDMTLASSFGPEGLWMELF